MRQLLATLVLSLILGPLAGYIMIALGLSVKIAGFALFAGVVGAMAIGTRVPTSANRFPSIRVLRDAPGDVGHIVALNRSTKLMIGLFDGRSNLLAKPLVLKGAAAMPTKTGAVRALASDQNHLEQAIGIIAKRCMNADVLRIADNLGLRSFKALARKAIAGQG
ncbi:MAG: hypothetical protein QM831_46345 [Kofleriaceae bacterium]